MQSPSAEQRKSWSLLVSRSRSGDALAINGRAPRGPFQQPVDGTSLQDAVRFWGKVRFGPGCWEWRASPSQEYGAFRLRGKPRKAHRVAYEMTRGPLPKGAVLRHDCDNPRCVRPGHLRPGSFSDNVQDAIERGRWANGNSRKAACKRRHEPNWCVDRKGHRKCRPCAALYQRERKARLRAIAEC